MYNYDVDYLRKVAKEFGLKGDFGLKGLKFIEDNKAQLDYYDIIYKKELAPIRPENIAIFNSPCLNIIFGYLLNKPVISEKDLLEKNLIQIASEDEEVFNFWRNNPAVSLLNIVENTYGELWKRDIKPVIAENLIIHSAIEGFIPNFSLEKGRSNYFSRMLKDFDFQTIYVEGKEELEEYKNFSDITIENGYHIWQTFENVIKGLVLRA